MARGNAKRDAQRDSGASDDNCKHPAPWDSNGPTTDDTGKECTIYHCSDCGKHMRTYYYDD